MDPRSASGVQMYIVSEVENTDIVIGDDDPAIGKSCFPKQTIRNAHTNINFRLPRLADRRDQDLPPGVEGGCDGAKGRTGTPP